MAKTAISGTAGNFSLTGHNFRCRAWSADLVQELNDSTGFAQAPWREQIGGLKSLSGMASGYLEYNDANTNPGYSNISSTGVAFTLTATTGCTYSGTATVSVISVGTSVDGNATVSIRFSSTGAVSEAWDESAS